MATRIFPRASRTRITPAEPVPGIPPAPETGLPGYELIDDAATSARRTWSSQRIAEAVAAGAGEGGVAGGTLYLAASVSGGPNAIVLDVPGLVLSETPVLVAFDPIANNTAAGTIKVNTHDAVALLGRLNNVLIADEVIAPITHIVRVSLTSAKIISGSI